MSKRILVKTDDPDKEKFYLTVTGQVERVVTVSPAAVYLNGNAGGVLKQTIEITPSPKYNFSILGLEHNTDSGVFAVIVAPVKKDDPWRINVEIVSETQENVFDILVVKTDSIHRPEIRIRVSALFTKNELSGSGTEQPKQPKVFYQPPANKKK